MYSIRFKFGIIYTHFSLELFFDRARILNSLRVGNEIIGGRLVISFYTRKTRFIIYYHVRVPRRGRERGNWRNIKENFHNFASLLWNARVRRTRQCEFMVEGSVWSWIKKKRVLERLRFTIAALCGRVTSTLAENSLGEKKVLLCLFLPRWKTCIHDDRYGACSDNREIVQLSIGDLESPINMLIARLLMNFTRLHMLDRLSYLPIASMMFSDQSANRFSHRWWWTYPHG